LLANTFFQSRPNKLDCPVRRQANCYNGRCTGMTADINLNSKERDQRYLVDIQVY
jgi:hypothetical protein